MNSVDFPFAVAAVAVAVFAAAVAAVAVAAVAVAAVAAVAAKQAGWAWEAEAAYCPLSH